MRQIILDTETTGLDPKQGHKIIEIGCVEMINRRLTGNNYHQYINPRRKIDAGAIQVHGITNEFLQDKPYFKDIVQDFLAYVRGAELVIHNAAFDIGFINHELRQARSKIPRIERVCTVLDTLALARKKHPAQRNSLDVLCKRYGIDNSHRELHGALLDAEILADVYIHMTSGQTQLGINDEQAHTAPNLQTSDEANEAIKVYKTPLIMATAEETKAHQERLEAIKASTGEVLWSED